MGLLAEPVVREVEAPVTRSFSAAVPRRCSTQPLLITRQASVSGIEAPTRPAQVPQLPLPQEVPRPASKEPYRAPSTGPVPVATVVRLGSAPRSTTPRPTVAAVATVPAVPTVPRSGLLRTQSGPSLSARQPAASQGVQTACWRPCVTFSAQVPVGRWVVPMAPVQRGRWSQLPARCNSQLSLAAARGSQGPAVSLATEIDLRYPLAPLVNDIVEATLRQAPQAFQAPDLRRDLKPRLRNVIMEALHGPGRLSRSQGAAQEVQKDRVVLGVALHFAEAWAHFTRASRRQCAQNGLSRDLSDRLLEAVRTFLGLDEMPEESPSDKYWEMPPDQPLQPIDDLPPLLCTQSSWEQEELPRRSSSALQEPVAMTMEADGYPQTSPSSTLDFAWLLPAGQSPSDGFHERTLEALQLPGVHAREAGPPATRDARASFPASHRSPDHVRSRSNSYDHVQARVDTNLSQSAKSSPRSGRSASRLRSQPCNYDHVKAKVETNLPESAKSSPRSRSPSGRRRTGSSSPRVTKLLLPGEGHPVSPRGNSPPSPGAMEPRHSLSNGIKSPSSEKELNASSRLTTQVRPGSAPWRR